MANIRASHLLTQALQLRGDSTGFHLDIQLNAHTEAKQDDILAQMIAAAGLKLEQASDEIWQAREGLFQDGATVIKCSARPSAIFEYVDFLQKSTPEVEFVFVALASGLIYFSPVAPSTALADFFHTLEGDYFVLSSPTIEVGWKAGSNAIRVMRAVKHQFDPNQTLNPGRFLAGI